MESLTGKEPLDTLALRRKETIKKRGNIFQALEGPSNGEIGLIKAVRKTHEVCN